MDRLRVDFEAFRENPFQGISAEFDGNNENELIVTFDFTNSADERHSVKAIITFPEYYPYGSPAVWFTTYFWHSNVSPDGELIDYDLLNEDGSAYYSLENVTMSILSMLLSTLDESPAAVEAPVVLRENSRVRFCMDEHNFVLVDKAKKFHCDGCKQQGSGPRYRCDNECHFELHEVCRFPKPTTYYDLFGSSEVHFFNELQQSFDGPIKCCDACGKAILGYHYYCASSDSYIHPCCIALNDKQNIDGILFELRKEVLSSKCPWCTLKTTSSDNEQVKGWSYISRCEEYHFHVHCMMKWMDDVVAAKDEINPALQKIELKHLTKSMSKYKKGSKFLKTLKIILKTVISILLGDPTTLLATVVDLIFND